LRLTAATHFYPAIALTFSDSGDDIGERTGTTVNGPLLTGLLFLGRSSLFSLLSLLASPLTGWPVFNAQ
jgi:hypothetical protein